MLQQKWTEPSIAAGFVAVPARFLRSYADMEPPLTDFEFIFVVNLVDYMRGDGKPAFASWDTLAADLSVEPEIIRSTIESLKAKGYLEEVAIQRDRGELTGYDIRGLRKKLDEMLSPPVTDSPRHRSPR